MESNIYYYDGINYELCEMMLVNIFEFYFFCLLNLDNDIFFVKLLWELDNIYIQCVRYSWYLMVIVKKILYVLKFIFKKFSCCFDFEVVCFFLQFCNELLIVQ